jgi:hypothetical protein
MVLLDLRFVGEADGVCEGSYKENPCARCREAVYETGFDTLIQVKKEKE